MNYAGSELIDQIQERETLSRESHVNHIRFTLSSFKIARHQKPRDRIDSKFTTSLSEDINVIVEQNMNKR